MDSSSHTCNLRTSLWLSKRLILGQVLSFAVSATGVFSTLLVNDNRSFPLLQSGCAYLWITVLFLPTYYFALKNERAEAPHYGRYANFAPLTKLWRYPLIAIVDLEANYAVVKAYQYTDMTSVQLLDCCTIPFVMLLSYFVMHVRYGRYHAVGACIAIAGLGFLIALDADGLSRSASAPKPLLGDMLCVVSSACYAISNVACEKLIKVNDAAAVDDGHTTMEGDVPTSIAGIDGGPPASQDLQDSGDDRYAAAASAMAETAPLSHGTPSTPLSPSGPPYKIGQPMGSRATDERVLHAGSSNTTDNDGTQVPQRAGTDAAPAALLPKVPSWMPVLEYLACMPPCGLCFALLQLAIVEWPDLNTSLSEGWASKDVAYQLLFGLSMVVVYSGMPVLFFYSSATFANLSLLTADVYSIVWNVTIFSIRPRWEFFVAYLLIVAGIVVFDTKGLEAIRKRFYRLLPS